jgi:hypothetical protein
MSIEKLCQELNITPTELEVLKVMFNSVEEDYKDMQSKSAIARNMLPIADMMKEIAPGKGRSPEEMKEAVREMEKSKNRFFDEIVQHIRSLNEKFTPIFKLINNKNDE